MNLVIFDCDGTLVDSQHMIVAAMEGAFDRAGIPRPAPVAIRSIIGLSLEGAVRRLLAPEMHPRALQIADDYKEAFRELRQRRELEEPLYPGVREALLELALRDDVLLAIATGKSRRGVDAVLLREGLAQHFVSIQTADDHPSKPDPSMVLQALAETGADASRTLMVGDTTYDMEMAANAGVAGIGVAWGYHPEGALVEAGASHVIAQSPGLGASLKMLLLRHEVRA
jgi:phosphoglycolate phosphatase